jgi:hypothetical protein
MQQTDVDEIFWVRARWSKNLPITVRVVNENAERLDYYLTNIYRRLCLKLDWDEKSEVTP